MFPGYDLKQCPPDHPIYSSYEKLEGKPTMHILSNGVRPLVVHSDYDLAKSWQIRATATRKKDFLIIPNMVRYVVGRKTDRTARPPIRSPSPA